MESAGEIDQRGVGRNSLTRTSSSETVLSGESADHTEKHIEEALKQVSYPAAFGAWRRRVCCGSSRRRGGPFRANRLAHLPRFVFPPAPLLSSYKQSGHLFPLPGQTQSGREGETGALFEANLRRLDRSPPAEDADPERHRSFEWNDGSSFEPFGTKDDNLGYDARSFYHRLLGSGSLEPTVRISEQRATTRHDVQANFARQSPIDDAEGSVPVLFGSSPHFGRSPPASAGVDVFPGRVAPSPSYSLKQSFDNEADTIKPTKIVVIEKLPQQVSADTIGQLCSVRLLSPLSSLTRI
jgi:hypothetical protein